MDQLSTPETHLLSLKKFDEISKAYVLRNEHFTSESSRFSLLSKITYNLSKGHFDFVYQLLKCKLDNSQTFLANVDPNEQASLRKDHLAPKNWLQFETIANQEFLNGKTPLILCNFIEEKWSVTLTRMLIQCGAIVSKEDSVNGCHALHYACARLNPQLVDILLRNVDFNLELATDSNGNTPLVYLIVSFHYNWRILPVNRRKRITASLIKYLEHLIKMNLCVDTANRLGYSVSDFYSVLCPEPVDFFSVLKSALGVGREFKGGDEILKRSLLINLKEIRELRPAILRAENPDTNLIFMFLRKETNRSHSDAWKKYRASTKLVYEYNKSTGQISLKRKWNDDLLDLYSKLEIHQSPAYRSGAQIHRQDSLPDIILSELTCKRDRGSLVSSLNSSTRLSKNSNERYSRKSK